MHSKVYRVVCLMLMVCLTAPPLLGEPSAGTNAASQAGSLAAHAAQAPARSSEHMISARVKSAPAPAPSHDQSKGTGHREKIRQLIKKLQDKESPDRLDALSELCETVTADSREAHARQLKDFPCGTKWL